MLGIVVAISVFTALSSVLPEKDPDASQPIAGWIKIALGVLLLLHGGQAVAQPAGDR